MEFELQTLTPIWTGGVQESDNTLHITGIKGSIRWWYEVLIRGLGYYACDPRTEFGCKLDTKKLNRDLSFMSQVEKTICPA